MALHFLTVQDIVCEQLDQLAVYGGGSPGILNEGRIDAAVAGAQNASFYVGEDVFEIGAAYLQYLVLGHAFENGNKRVSLAGALLFMYINGVKVEVDCASMTKLVIDTCTHAVEKEDVARFFREHAITFESSTERASALAEARLWAHALYAETFSELAK